MNIIKIPCNEFSVKTITKHHMFYTLTFHSVCHFHLLQDFTLHFLWVAKVKALFFKVIHDFLLQFANNFAGGDYIDIIKTIIVTRTEKNKYTVTVY